jgi:hypothetical protein
MAVGGIMVSAMPAPAAVTFNAGDLILGVRDNSNTSPNVYLFDLGNLPVTNSTVATGLTSDLTALFGSGWHDDTNLYWGVFGYTGTNTLVVGQAEQTLGTQASGYGAITTANRNIIKGLFNNVATATPSPAGQYVNGSTVTASGQFTSGGTSVSNTKGVAVLNTASNGYAQFMPNWQNFLSGYENTTGFNGTAEDMFTVTGTGSTYGGTYTVNSNGDVSFSLSPPTTVPEPGRATLLGLGMMAAVFRRRRPALSKVNS